MKDRQPLAISQSGTICIVVCYFGKCPAWIYLFLASCKTNPTIHFLIFTDCIHPVATPPNVEIVYASLQQIRTKASERLGFDVTIDTPYKVCDLKPAYGEVFSEYLAPYDFWGMTDLDVIFGNIRQFIDDEILRKFDVINAYSDYIVGHFCLYRNTPFFRSLFRESRDFKKVLQSKEMLSFTECGRQWRDFSMHQNRGDDSANIDSMTHVVNRLAAEQRLRAYFATLVKEKPNLHKTEWLLCWDNGRLYEIKEGREIMYFHFHLFKQSNDFHIPDWKLIPERFYINKHGFFV